MDLGTLSIKIMADLKGMVGGLGRAGRMLNTFARRTTGILASMGRSFLRFGKIVTMWVGGLAVATAAASWKMIKFASTLEETQSKFNVVFREMKEDANAWAVHFGKVIGRAEVDIKSWMAGLQDTFRPLGFTAEKSYDLSKALTQLALDVASFNDKADPDVIRDFTSALVGNHETVRKYGIIITENALKQEALNQGITKSFKEFSELEKVQLRVNMLFKGTSDAQGDLIRTQDSFANRYKKFKAILKDMATGIGTVLLPAATDLIGKLNEWMTANEELIRSKIAEYIIKLGVAVKNLFNWIKEHREEFANFAKTVGSIAGSIGKVGQAVFGFGKAGLSDIQKRAFANIFDEMDEDLEKAFAAATEKYQSRTKGVEGFGEKTMLANVSRVWQAEINRLKELEIRANLMTSIYQKAVGAAKSLGNALKSVGQDAEAAAPKLFNYDEIIARWAGEELPGGAGEGAGKTKKDAKKTADTVRDTWGQVADGIGYAFQNTFRNILDRSKSFGDAMKDLAKDLLSNIASIYANLAITKMMGGLGTFPGLGFLAPTPMAAGGIVTSPTLAMIGEGGQSEAVIPLDKLEGMGGVTINIYNPWDGQSVLKTMESTAVKAVLRNYAGNGSIRSIIRQGAAGR